MITQPPTTAGTFEPDWRDLADELWDVLDRRIEGDEALEAAEWLIRQYQRQAAAAGLVMVRREDVLTARTALRAAPRLAEDTLERFDAIYDAGPLRGDK